MYLIEKDYYGHIIIKNKKEQNVRAGDVNNFLKKYNKQFTAKVFRTWSVNKLFVKEALKFKTIPTKENDRKKDLEKLLVKSHLKFNTL